MCEIYENMSFEKGELKFKIPDGVKHLSYDPITGLFPNEHSDPNQLLNGWYNVKVQ